LATTPTPMATLKLTLDTRRKKSNGTYPLVFRLTHLTKSTTIPTALSLEIAEWDNKKQRVRKTNPTADTLNNELTKLRFAYQKGLMKVDSINLLDVTALKNTIIGKEEPTVKIDFFSYAKREIESLLATNKVGNAAVYECATNSLKEFTQNPKLKFEQLNYKLLMEYESFLLKRELKTNTIANYMRTIRAIFNKSIKTNNTGIEHYPFINYSIKHERTIAKVLNQDQFHQINSLDLSPESPEYLCRAVFMVTFNLIGISFSDLATLKPSNIVDGRVTYRRKKTKRIYSIKLNSYAEQIINDLKTIYPNSPYLLPIINNDKLSAYDEHRTIKQKLKTCNKYLKRIGELVKLELSLVSYCARYSWATTAKRMGFSNEIIAEALGHEYGNSVTATYLDGFSQSTIDNANQTVTSQIFDSMRL
jgi:integrase/recombinase XerD